MEAKAVAVKVAASCLFAVVTELTEKAFFGAPPKMKTRLALVQCTVARTTVSTYSVKPSFWRFVEWYLTAVEHAAWTQHLLGLPA